MYYLSSKNKGADQLHGYRKAHRRNQEVEMYTHTSGVDHEQGSLSRLGGSGALPREEKRFSGWLENDFKPLLWKEICFLSRDFYKECSCLFFTLRTCVVCVMGITPLKLICIFVFAYANCWVSHILFVNVCISVAMFTTDFLISGISSLNENIVVLTYEKEKFLEVNVL